MTRKKDDFEKYLEKQLKNKEFKEEYKALETLHTFVEAEIRIRHKQNIDQKTLPKV